MSPTTFDDARYLFQYKLRVFLRHLFCASISVFKVNSFRKVLAQPFSFCKNGIQEDIVLLLLQLFNNSGRYLIETSPLICRANQWMVSV